MSLLKLGGIVLALLLLLRFARLTFSDLSNRLSGGMTRVTVMEDEYGLPGRVPQLAQATTSQALEAPVPPEMPAAAPEVPVFEVPPEHIWRQQLIVLANQRPDLIADLIQNWLAEG